MLPPGRRTPTKKEPDYPTDRALPKPDISSAADSSIDNLSIDNLLIKSEINATLFPMPVEAAARGDARRRDDRSKRASEAVGAQPGRRATKEKNFFVFFGRNPLKSPDSTKQIQA